MAKRFIDADDFYKRQAKRCFYNIPILGTCTMDKISLREALKEQPTADVVEVRHGEWIWTENGEADYEQYWVCSVCGEKSYIETKYCSDCGAKMDKGVAE